MSIETFNLDNIAAKRAQAMVSRAKQGISGVKNPVDTLEHLVTKAIGVLQEQGVYAMMLFLFSRTGDEDKAAPLIRDQLYEALKQLPSLKNSMIEDWPDKALEFYSARVLDDLDTLLLVRDLYEQTLIYARYGAKAADKKPSGG
jgi:hypothetical protein